MQNNFSTTPRTQPIPIPKAKNQQNGKTQKRKKMKAKRINRELNNVEHEIKINGQSRKIAGVTKKDLNPYVATLVDPENVHGIRFPDDLPKATSAVRALINHNSYYFTDDVCEPKGTYMNVVSPTVVYPMLEYALEDVTFNGSASVQETQTLFGGVTRPDDEVGLWPLDSSAPSVSAASNQMYIPADETMNLKCDWHWVDQDFAFPPFKGQDNSGLDFYGVPLCMNTLTAGTPSGLISVYVATNQPALTTTSPFLVEAVAQGKNPIALAPGTVTAGDRAFQFTINGASIAALSKTGQNANAYFPLPGVGFRVTNTSSRQLLITSYSVGISLSQIGAGNTSTFSVPRLRGVAIPDHKTFLTNVDQYRVVSMSHWLEYDGSDLNNGGQCASVLYRAGQSAGEVGLYDYQSIAECPESYAGPVKHGTYSIWAPNSEADMLMRCTLSAERWSYPYIVNAGVMSTPEQVNALRSRVAINYELVSKSQLWTPEKPVPHPEWIRGATLLLRTHPCTMANGAHFDWIRGVLRDAVDLGKGVGKWAVDNKDWLVPAGTALASLLL